MSELKRTQFFDIHVAAGATMVDFGGWEMPVQYPTGIVAEHLYTRSDCSLFDVSHMGRLLIEGPERVKFLQYVLSSNVLALELNTAQYCIIPDENGYAIDDAYLYMFEEDKLLLVVNAANTEKDLAHLLPIAEKFDVKVTDITPDWAAIAVQGPRSRKMLEVLSGGVALTEPVKNALGTVQLEGHLALVAKTGYTGEPLGYEVYVKSEDAAWLWNRLIELGAAPIALGARDTLRLEAGLPLYGHEMGEAPDGSEIRIFSVPLSRFAVSFADEKGDYIGKELLAAQKENLTDKIVSIALLDRGVIRAGMDVYRNGEKAGWVTSGTMVPYWNFDENGNRLETTGKRSIGFACIAGNPAVGDELFVDVRGKKLKAVVVAKHMIQNEPPYGKAVLTR